MTQWLLSSIWNIRWNSTSSIQLRNIQSGICSRVYLNLSQVWKKEIPTKNQNIKLILLSRKIGWKWMDCSLKKTMTHDSTETEGKFPITTIARSYLFHQARFPLAERRVPPQFIVNKFHLNLHSSLGLFPVRMALHLALLRCAGRWSLLRRSMQSVRKSQTF